MAAKTRPLPPFGADNQAAPGLRLLAWLKAHPFNRERVLEEVWAGRVAYQKAMGK